MGFFSGTFSKRHTRLADRAETIPKKNCNSVVIVRPVGEDCFYHLKDDHSQGVIKVNYIYINTNQLITYHLYSGTTGMNVQEYHFKVSI